MSQLEVSVGKTILKNPLIAGSAEHLIEAGGVRSALRAGVGAVVAKSTNESERGRDQLQRAEYMLLDDEWREMAWTPNAPSTAFIACRSGLTPQGFEAWLDQTAQLDREARASDAYAIASLIVADLAQTVAMAKQVEQAGLRVIELNIGTPYASQAKGVVSTELDPERVAVIVSAVRQAIGIPLWVKITGQSERVPDLAAAAFRAGGEAVIMAGRLLGFIPDVETMQPFLGTTLGVGGYWNLPLTWLAGRVTAAARYIAAGDRDQRRAQRSRCRTDDARRGERGGDGIGRDAARGASALIRIARTSRLSAAQGNDRSRACRCRGRPAQDVRRYAVAHQQLEKIRG